jgi:predicted nucleotidyltransferase
MWEMKADSSDLNISQEGLAEICRRYHVQRLALFGSALRRDFRAEIAPEVEDEGSEQLRLM